jgi:D-glycero-alpha-D-manno-heptose 1-phosphate guanylyltransferase
MVVRHIENNTRYGGVTLNSDNQISAFGEESFISNSLINGGIYLLEPTLFDNNSLPTTAISLENDIMPGLFKESANRCFGFISDANFIDIGIPADYERAVEHVD